MVVGNALDSPPSVISGVAFFSTNGIQWERIDVPLSDPDPNSDGTFYIREVDYFEGVPHFLIYGFPYNYNENALYLAIPCPETGSGTVLSTNSNGSIQATTATSGTTTTSWSSSTGTRMIITVHPV